MKVLLVDDNALYRAAFRRNLLLNNYDVTEAENGEEAVKVWQESRPDVVITDLSMRTPSEGLDVIRSLKQLDPLLPVVMISAVGTFEEGAEAQRLGAERVLSKAKIDDQIEELYKALESAGAASARNRECRREIEVILAEPENVPAGTGQRLRVILADAKLHPVVRQEAFDALMLSMAADARRSADSSSGDERQAGFAEVDARLAQVIPDYAKFSPESLKELRTAEFFFHQPAASRPQGADFSRNTGFSYCFAVENEAKVRLRKRLQKFLSTAENIHMIRRLIDTRSGQLDVFFHQYLLRLHQQIPFDFTIDNVRQVLSRVLEHEVRYRPDGLKALGILLVCFGRDYNLRAMRENIHIANPLGIRGFESDMHLLRFAHLLVSLQHYRNPYIHPEISEMEKISKIRETAIQCLKEMPKLSL